MVRLIATKSMSYNTRRLMPGDEFDAKDRDARILVGIAKARRVREPGEVPSPPESLTQKASGGSDDLSALRAEYQEKMGKRPFNGWDAETLNAKMAEAD
jgi:hypothetical protein